MNKKRVEIIGVMFVFCSLIAVFVAAGVYAKRGDTDRNENVFTPPSQHTSSSVVYEPGVRSGFHDSDGKCYMISNYDLYMQGPLECEEVQGYWEYLGKSKIMVYHGEGNAYALCIQKKLGDNGFRVEGSTSLDGCKGVVPDDNGVIRSGANSCLRNTNNGLIWSSDCGAGVIKFKLD